MRKVFVWFLVVSSLPSLLIALNGWSINPTDAPAKAPLQETPPGDYPAPPVATPTTDLGYAAPPAATLSIPTPYPATGNTGPESAPTATAVSVIGDNQIPPNNSDNASNFPLTTGEMLRNRSLLWGGFLVALLILGVGIYGAIAIYTRKQEK